MKNAVLYIIASICFVQLGFAEYNGHHISFEATLLDGSVIKGYTYKPTIYQEDRTISYKEFLEANYRLVLQNDFEDGVGPYAYFKNKIKYTYNSPYIGVTQTLYKLLHKKAISVEQVDTFKIIKLTEQSYSIQISSKHTLDDLEWMQQPPIQEFSFGGNFCTYDIFIHKTTQKTEAVIQRLEALRIAFKDHLQYLELQLNVTNGQEYYDTQKEIDAFIEAQDKKIAELVQNFEGEKVVVVTMCSC